MNDPTGSIHSPEVTDQQTFKFRVTTNRNPATIDPIGNNINVIATPENASHTVRVYYKNDN